MKALAIAATDLRRLLRWRANIFFLFLLPMLIILLLGASFGVDSARIGIVGDRGGVLARQLSAELAAGRATDLRRYGAVPDLERAVARNRVDAGLVLPADYDARLRDGRTVTLRYFGRPDSFAQQLRATVQSAVADQNRLVAAARALARARHVPFDAALARARAVAATVAPVRVVLTGPDGSPFTGGSGRFDRGASTQLLLFIFLSSLTGAAWLLETRRLGIARRILSTPTSTRTFLAGQVLARLAVALLQALIIVAGSLLFFGVDWGDPLGTAVVVVAFCLVGTGAAVLLGSVFSSEQQIVAVALLLGLGFAALGGSMAPLEIFPRTARTIAHVTPHAWANDAFSKLIGHGGTLATVLPQVGALLGFAAVALTLAVWRLRRTLTAG